VSLVVSLGAAPPAPPPVVCVVPKVKNKSLHTTERMLTAAHCRAGKVKHAFSRMFKKGRVISAKPGAGRKLPERSKVALTVSKGKRASGR
jgi:beta-lactam-binding protein with PASTA domain